MAKPTKNSQNTTPDIEPSTSSAKPKKTKICHQPKTRTRSKKSPQPCSKCSGKVKRMIKKAKNTVPSVPKNKASKKTAPPKKKTKRALFHRRRPLMDEMATSTETEAEQTSSDSSTLSSSDEESQ